MNLPTISKEDLQADMYEWQLKYWFGITRGGFNEEYLDELIAIAKDIPDVYVSPVLKTFGGISSKYSSKELFAFIQNYATKNSSEVKSKPAKGYVRFKASKEEKEVRVQISISQYKED